MFQFFGNTTKARRQHRRVAPARRLSLEPLERRQLLAIDSLAPPVMVERFDLPIDDVHVASQEQTQAIDERDAASDVRHVVLPAGTGATVSGIVWFDDDGDSLQSYLEEYMDGVAVRLLTPDLLAVQATVTDEYGTYIFEDVAPGNYLVEFELPESLEFVQANRRDEVYMDSDADPFTGRTVVFGVLDDATNEYLDAGLRLPLEFPWHNPAPGEGMNVDDSSDGVVPQDLLYLLDELHRNGYREFDPPSAANASGFHYFDVVPDNKLQADDILQVRDEINRRFGPIDTGFLASREKSPVEAASPVDRALPEVAMGIVLWEPPLSEPMRLLDHQVAAWRKPGGSPVIYQNRL